MRPRIRAERLKYGLGVFNSGLSFCEVVSINFLCNTFVFKY